MYRKILFLLLWGCFCMLHAQQSPMVTGNNTFYAQKPNATTIATLSGIMGEAYFNEHRYTTNNTLYSVGFPYRMVYTSKAFNGELKVSKGYYSTYVLLSWKLNRNDKITKLSIYRRTFQDTTYTLSATVASTESAWQDLYAEPSTMYQYKVVADGVWDTEIENLNRVTGVGFRVSSATVTGRVTYKGSIVVPNVKMQAEPNIPSRTGEFSYHFPNVVNSHFAQITTPKKVDFTSGVSIQAWVKADTLSNKPQLPIFAIGDEIVLGLSKIEGNMYVNIQMGSESKASSKIASKDLSQFMQLTLSWNPTLKQCVVYLNGDSLFAPSFTKELIANGTWFIGKNSDNYFSGYMDEIKLWKKALTAQEVYATFDSYENPNNPDLVGYWKLNEGGGAYFYDISRVNNTFNENHASLYNGADDAFTTVIPSASQLGFKATTDKNGNYVIAGISYASGGSYFRVVPSLGIHRFDPSDKLLYISQESSVFNNTNFTDVSSFRFTGNVRYEGTKYPVSDVYVKIDGSTVSDSKKQPIKTNASGNFEIEVPIGEHYISIEKNGHVFNSAYWPALDENENTTLFDFQDDVYGIEFIDTTKVKLVGKIVGGSIQAAKVTGSKTNPSLNNLGVVYGSLTTERGFDLWNNSAHVTFQTNPVTGVFEVELIPEKFVLSDNTSLKNSRYTFNRTQDIGSIDMSNKLNLQYTIDSINRDTTINNEIVQLFERVDTVLAYHHNRDWIWRSAPEIEVNNFNDSAYWGEENYIYISSNQQDTTLMPLFDKSTGQYAYSYPVFFKDLKYGLKVIAYEQYINADDETKIDVVPVIDGSIVVENPLAKIDAQAVLPLNTKGETVHKFMAGDPLTASPFHKTLTMKLKVGNQFVAGAEFQQPAYIFGATAMGNPNFTTGPDKIVTVLRDPPGSNSYSYIKKGYSTSNISKHNFSNGFGGDIDMVHLMGVQVTTQAGLGFSTTTDIETTNSLGLTTSHNYNRNNDGTLTRTTTYQFDYSTSNDPQYVGSLGDVFIGNGTNYFYSAATNVRLIKNETTGTYTVGAKKALAVGEEALTSFAYSQNHIKTNLIPNLIQSRNALFETVEYTSRLSASHADYGKNNNDPAFKDNPIKPSVTATEITGPSYTYTPKEGSVIEDKVAMYNQRIAQWKTILATNERMKIKATPGFDNHFLYTNLSFDAGSSIESSISTDSCLSASTGWEFSVGGGIATELGFTLNKFGFKTTINEKYSHNESGSTGTENNTNQTLGFVLADGDNGDYFSVDVLKDSLKTPVFKLKGGQSSCPYEGKEVSQYYKPGKEVISDGTMQIEVPTLNIQTATVANVPEGTPALFTIFLSNESEVEADCWYGLFLDAASNPDGAIVKVDGKALVGGMTVLVPAGKTIKKTVVVEKGRAEVNAYENMNIIMHSLCQFDPTDNVDDISDTVKISAYFTETCTEVALLEPLNQWVVNASNHNKVTGKYEMAVKIGGYDLNHGKFNNLRFQYKPSETSSWIHPTTFLNGLDDTNNDGDTININGAASLSYVWDMTSLQNRKYDIRMVSQCSDGSVFTSEVLTGIYDNVLPTPFGSPQPADGVLSPNDEIMLSFNEEIQAGLINDYNISFTGIQNGTDLRDFDYLLHDAGLHFDGIAQNMTVPQNINLKYSPFTIEFWAKRERTGIKECLISHGDVATGGLWIGFDAENHFVMTLNGTTVTSEAVFTKTGIYNHYAAVFDNSGKINSNELRLIVASNDATDVLTKTTDVNYFGSSSILVGYDGTTAFKGNIHDLRIWNQSSSPSEIGARRYTIVNGYEKGLIGAWSMNDAYGTLAKDMAFSRHGQVNATWHVSKIGSALNCNSGYALFNSSQLEITSTADFTLEFWFKSLKPSSDEYIFSNGKADGTDNSALKWAIVATASDSIKIMNDGKSFAISGKDYLNNQWHHFALSVNRRGNMTVYLDGKSKLSQSSGLVTGMGGAGIALGARYYMPNAVQTTADMHFSGSLDEVRIWNGARNQDLINKFMNHSLRGTEMGLKAYFPFEDVTVSDPSVNNQTMKNMTMDSLSIAGNCSLKGSAAYTLETPTIKLAMPSGKIPYTFTVKENQILITPNIDASRIENTTLDVAIDGVYDMHGNKMESTASWSAFVDKNQLVWEKQQINLECSPKSTPTFTLNIMNKGGEKEYWQIENLPVWLTANMEQGTLDPLSSQEVTFTVNPSINVGQYSNDIYVNGSMDYNERCKINLSVKDEAPSWTVEPSNFESSMTLIGKLVIAGDFSTDNNDVVGAFVNDQCRGVANVQYFANRDIYLVNLTVFGAEAESNQVKLKVWDASTGNLYTIVSPSFSYKSNDILGTTTAPRLIETSSSIGREIPVLAGWNWLSFNLASGQLDSTDMLMAGVRSATDDVIKLNEGMFDQYVAPYGWDGSFSGKSFEVSKMYKLKNSFADTIQLSGVPLQTSAHSIYIQNGWNWIGYTPQYKMPVSSAMSYHTPTQDDLVKSQSKFAMYDETIGWIGSLSFMQPNAGYMYHSNNTNSVSFVYPQETLFKTASLNNSETETEFANGEYEHNMSAFIALAANPVKDITKAKLIAVSNGKVVGETLPIQKESEWIFPLSIFGESAEKELSFVLLDGELNSTHSALEKAIYRPNEILGTVNNPFELTFATVDQNPICVTPNPFKEWVNINNIPVGTTKAVLFDIQGKVIRQWTSFDGNTFIWNGMGESGAVVTSGVYTLKFLGSDASQSVLIIKLNE